MSVPDPKQLEKNKIEFLEAIYTMAAEAGRQDDLFAPHADEIGTRCGFDPDVNHRVHSDLKWDGLIDYFCVGPHCMLTKTGRDVIEDHLFRKTAKGRVRALGSGAKDLGNKGMSKAGGYVAGLVSGWVTATGTVYFRPVVDVVKNWLGLK